MTFCYVRADWPGNVYLGIGKRKGYTYGANIEFTEKYLVLIQSEEEAHIGYIFKNVEDDFGSTQEDWDLFEIEGSNPMSEVTSYQICTERG